jgi:superfamily II DNA or RNA helicase
MKKYGKSWIDDRATSAVASVQTLASRRGQADPEIKRFVHQVRLAVFDEGHHYIKKGQWGKGVDMFEASKVLFVTATPERADGKGLHVSADGYVEGMVEGPTVAWLIDQGYLSPFKYFCPETDLDVEGVAVTATGDFNAKEMRKRVVGSHLIGDVVKQWQQFANGKRTIVFSTDVESATEQSQAFTSVGCLSHMLCGATDPLERDSKLDEFEGGSLTTLCNVDLFDEGFDVPGVECAIHARPTQSLAKKLQIDGRALRPVYVDGYDLSTREGRRAAIANGPKPYAVIIDPVRNWERHGLPDWPRQWNIYGRQGGGKSSGPSDTVAQRVCVGCTQPYPAFFNPCPYCGTPHEPSGRKQPEQVDGDLHELDVESLRALFKAQQDAGMSRAEFEQELVGRNVPPIGRPRLVKMHEAAKYRRGVLRNMVGWWVGMQPEGRTLSEKHRRFYHRFGVDIGTAFTLGADETDKLIQTIQERFDYDIADR